MRKTVAVQDHALLRYLERVMGLDLAKVRNQIADLVQPAVDVGASAYTADGTTYLLEGGAVVTVIAADSPLVARRPRRGRR